MKLDRHQQGVMLIGIVMLMVAVITTLSIWQPLVIQGSQHPNFFTNYQYGYVHRGLLGSILSVLFGDFDVAWTEMHMPLLQRGLAIFLMVLLWLCLIPKIALSQSYSPPMRWWLLAFSSVLLVAPIWKMESNWLGFVDVYIFLPLLLSCIALIARRPLLFAILMIIAQMFHRGGFLISLSLCMMAVYAAWFSPIFFHHRKKWLVAAIVPAVFFVLAGYLNDPERTARILSEANMYDSAQLERYIVYGSAAGGRTVKYYAALYLDYPNFFMWAVIIFAMPPFLLSALFFWFRKKHAMGFWHSANASFHSIPGKWLLKVEFLIPIAAAMTSLPIIIIGADIVRFMYWGWFNLSLITICQLWLFVPQPANTKTRQRKKQKNGRHKPIALWSTTAFLVSAAYMYAGAPLYNGHAVYVSFFPCTQPCIPLLNNNPFASYYGNFLRRKLLDLHYPLRFDAAQSRYNFLPHEKNVPLRNNSILIPASDKKIYVRNDKLIMPGNTLMTYSAYYRTDNVDGAVPSLILSINGKEITPQIITAEHSEWKVKLGKYPIIANISLISDSPHDFALSSVVIDRSRAP